MRSRNGSRFVLTSLCFLSASGCPTRCPATITALKIQKTSATFLSLCQTSTDPEIMKTVAAIKVRIGQASDSCETTRDKLVSRTSLDLSHTSIVDIRPLAGLTQLTTLDLSNTSIVDVIPLVGLT